MEKSNRGVLVLIILLLIIFSTLSIWGYIANKNGVGQKENVNREFKYNGKLYFYNMLELVGTYKCKTNDCDYATGTIDDLEYAINYYNTVSDLKTSLIAKKYALLVDGSNEVLLYDIVNSNIVNKYKEVKNYGIGIDGNYYILKDQNDKWGVIKLDDEVKTVIDFKYDYIGLHNDIKLGTKKLDGSIFVVKDNNYWRLISNEGIEKSTLFTNEIFDYNERYVITKNNSNYNVNYAISGVMVNTYNYARLIDKYMAIVDNNNDYYLINPESNVIISNKYKISSTNEVKLEKGENGISININGVLKETVK